MITQTKRPPENLAAPSHLPLGAVAAEISALSVFIPVRLTTQAFIPGALAPQRHDVVKLAGPPALPPKGRAFWIPIHSALGFWMSLAMMMFLISDLSWTGIGGEKIIQAWNTFPAEKWDAVQLSDDIHKSLNHSAVKEVPWALEETPMPMSGSDIGTVAITGPVTLDSVTAYARALGFNGRFQINTPADAIGVWTISHDSLSNDGPDPRGDRTIHIDQYTGKPLANVTLADYSVYAKMMGVGVAFHQGSMGLWNLILTTVFCLSMIVMPISCLIMWWKRCPENAGRLAAPPG